MTPPKQLLQLCQRFQRHLDAYKQGRYKEAQLRREFIDPLFKLMGWDMYNEQGYAEAYKEVIHEDAISVGGATKAPDYCFRIGGVRKFFLEAKKPSIDIKGAVHPAYQLRRYAWSAKLPLSILTDFEELAVYDCRIKPGLKDKPATARILYLTYEEYHHRWDELADIFSPEAIRKGSFDQWIEEKKTKRGTAEVDSAFLAEIERWRDLLARNIALRNPRLSQRELNFATQRTIDRIIFLRICEDRGIEPYGQLMALQNGERVYKRLMELFRRADDRYNSGLFHFEHQDGRPDESVDPLAERLAIDDRVLKDIFKNLYYPDSPYEFSVLPADILGQVYEQFLGKVIRLTPGHRAVVEDKPEVRKAGGVYYTPTYIVDYIVKQTVGKLLEGEKPGPRSPVNNLRILDPACGSGSFLLGAYQYLLNWHRDQYVADDPRKWSRGRAPKLFRAASGEWKLTTEERKRILLSNIYGVDIDPQAVEVTKLSLLLKVLEGEDEQTITRQLALFQRRALPDLGSNIKCGNSLIGPDFWSGKQMSLMDDEEVLRINAFDWDAEFPDIMKSGGFDAVIGNPPYIRIQALKEWAPLEVAFFQKRFETAVKGNIDIYVIFVERGFSLINEKGLLGFILPNKFISTDYGRELRKLISNKKALFRLVNFAHWQVFEQATTYTCLLFLSGEKPVSFDYVKAEPSSSILENNLDFTTYPSGHIKDQPWLLMTKEEGHIFDKLQKHSISLLEMPAAISRGSSSGDDSIFMLKRTIKRDHYESKNDDIVKIESTILRTPIFATDFSRYLFAPNNEMVIIFPYYLLNGKFNLISEIELKANYSNAYLYLQSHRKELEKRKQYKKWYGFSAPRNLLEHDKAQMLVPLLANQGLFAELPNNREDYCLMASGGFSISIAKKEGLSYKYVLGLLNSRLLFWYLKSISNIFRGGWITCTKQYVGKLPIRLIDFRDSADKTRHDSIIKLVEQMLDLKQRSYKTSAEQTKTALKRQIEGADRQIDKLVYKLYGLTEKEIKIVEESLG